MSTWILTTVKWRVALVPRRYREQDQRQLPFTYRAMLQTHYPQREKQAQTPKITHKTEANVPIISNQTNKKAGAETWNYLRSTLGVMKTKASAVLSKRPQPKTCSLEVSPMSHLHRPQCGLGCECNSCIYLLSVTPVIQHQPKWQFSLLKSL